MTRRCMWITVALGLLATPAILEPAHAGDGWWGKLDEGEAVSLANVMRAPAEFRGRTLTFFCIFHSASGKYRYYPPNTAFTEQRHLNFSVWPDGAPVWEERAFRRDLPFLYVTRTHAQRAEVVRLGSFTRIEVTGRIRDVVRGLPAIEVFSLRETGHRLGKEVVQLIIRANSNAASGSKVGYQNAARNLKEALKPDLPPVYKTMVEKLIAQALRKLGHDDEADRYERGETVGLPDLAEPDPDAAATEKDAPEAPILPESFPGSPDGDGFPPPSEDAGAPAPQAPVLPDDALPGRPRGAAGAGPPSTSPYTPSEDLPGRPTGQPPDQPAGRVTKPGELPRPVVKRGADDLGPPPAGPLPTREAAKPARDSKRPDQNPRAAPKTEEKRAAKAPERPRRGRASGIPPKRGGRLSGVR